MEKATTQQVSEFRKKYCCNPASRLQIANDFDVYVESFEELLPGNTVKSYATGSRDIDGAFVVFRVEDVVNDVIYYPVFSESVGRGLTRNWNLTLPSKMTIFTATNNHAGGGNGEENPGSKRKAANRQMLYLIQFVRSMMILHVDEPKPMSDPFKRIYDKLYSHPNYDVFVDDIKRVNSATHNFLNKNINTRNENFRNLQGYIYYVQERYPNMNLRDCNFEMFRNRLAEAYPDEEVVI